MKRLIERRKQLKLSQLDLEELTGISQSSISLYELGKSDPTGDVLRKIARALNTSVDWLLELTEDPTPAHYSTGLRKEEQNAIRAWRQGDKYRAIKAIVDDE